MHFAIRLTSGYTGTAIRARPRLTIIHWIRRYPFGPWQGDLSFGLAAAGKPVDPDSSDRNMLGSVKRHARNSKTSVMDCRALKTPSDPQTAQTPLHPELWVCWRWLELGMSSTGGTARAAAKNKPRTVLPALGMEMGAFQIPIHALPFTQPPRHNPDGVLGTLHTQCGRSDNPGVQECRKSCHRSTDPDGLHN